MFCLIMRLFCWLIAHDDSREFVRDGDHHMLVRCRCQRCDRVTEGFTL